eukprot:scaffold54173_cov34-Tisochrysis_lutea.AAC.1
MAASGGGALPTSFPCECKGPPLSLDVPKEEEGKFAVLDDAIAFSQCGSEPSGSARLDTQVL